MIYSNYHSCRDAFRVPEYSHICVTKQALASKQKIQTDEDRKQKLVNGLHKQLAVSRSKVLIRFSEFFIHDPKKKQPFFPHFACLRIGLFRKSKSMVHPLEN